MTSFKSGLVALAFAALLLSAVSCGPKTDGIAPPPARAEEAAPSGTSRPTESAPLPASLPQPPPPPASAPQPPAHSEISRPAEKGPLVVSGPLRRSDVLLSPRGYRPDWLDALHAFSANRIVWTYAGKDLVAEAATQGIAVQCAIPFWVPKDNPEGDEMSCVDPSGEPVTSPAVGAIFPDVNSDAWRRYVLDQTEKLIDAGCTSFQQDGAWMNYQNAVARNGCYSSESRTEFDAYFASGAPSDESHLGAEGRSPFELFQKRSTILYHEWLHASIDAYAARKSPGLDVTFSGNFAAGLAKTGEPDWLFPYFDFVLMEAFGDRKTMPNALRRIARQTSKLADVSGITIPHDDVWLNQRSIASAYAIGLTAIAPWDVYVGKRPRFLGDPADFAPLFRVVRSNQPLFDDYVSDADFYGAAQSSVVVAQGTVTKVDQTTYPNRTTIFWSRGGSFREVGKGHQVVVGGVAYRTTGRSHVGSIYLPRGADVSVGDPLYFNLSAGNYLISVRESIREPRKRAVHVVSWVEEPIAVSLHLLKSDFPDPPTMLVTPESPQPTPIAPRAVGDYYVYAVGDQMWAILY